MDSKVGVPEKQLSGAAPHTPLMAVGVVGTVVDGAVVEVGILVEVVVEVDGIVVDVVVVGTLVEVVGITDTSVTGEYTTVDALSVSL